jgi:hypothetical protein
VLFLSVVYSSVLLLPMLLVTAVFALATGPELAVFAVLTYVTAEVCPPGRWEVLQLAEAGAGPPPARGQGLQHSIVYESPLALRALRAWIEERMPHRRAEPAG